MITGHISFNAHEAILAESAIIIEVQPDNTLVEELRLQYTV